MIPIAIAGILFLALYENPNPDIEEKNIYCSLALLVTHEVIDHPKFSKVTPKGFGKFDKKLKKHIKSRVQKLDLVKRGIDHDELTDKVLLLAQKIHGFFGDFLENREKDWLASSCIYVKKRKKMYALCSFHHKNKKNIFHSEYDKVISEYGKFEKEWEKNKKLAQEIFLCGMITFLQRKLVWLIHVADKSVFDEEKLKKSKIKWEDENGLEEYANLGALMDNDKATLLDNYLSNCTRMLLLNRADNILKKEKNRRQEKEEFEWENGKFLGVGTMLGLLLCGVTQQVYGKKLGKRKNKKKQLAKKKKRVSLGKAGS